MSPITTPQADESVDDVQFLIGYSAGEVPAAVQQHLDVALHIHRQVIRAERGFGFGVTLECWRVRRIDGREVDLYVFLGGYDEAPVVVFLEEAAARLVGSAVGFEPGAGS